MIKLPQLTPRRRIIFIQLESERDYPREPLLTRMCRARTWENVRQWAKATQRD